MRRNRLPSILLDRESSFRRPISLGIYENIQKRKEDKELNENEFEMRLKRLGLDETYFNNRQ